MHIHKQRKNFTEAICIDTLFCYRSETNCLNFGKGFINIYIDVKNMFDKQSL